MATPRSDSPSTPSRSWNELARRASSELAPGDVDVRISLRAQLECGSRFESAEPSPSPTLWDDLSALSRVGWLRVLLLGGAALATVLVVAGAQALREAHDVAALAGPFLKPL